eukprot:5440774-Ditylum_brightwellii.AAC.1
MGKNLAFAHVKVIEELASSEIGTEKNESTIQVAFRRQSAAWDSSFDNTFPTKNSHLPYGAIIILHLFSNHTGSHQQSESNPTTPKYEVNKWSILMDPRIDAVDYAKTPQINNAVDTQHEGISCSKYFKARMDEYMKYNDIPKSNHAKLPKQQPKEFDTINQNQDAASHGEKKHKALRAKMFASFLIDLFGREFFQGVD